MKISPRSALAAASLLATLPLLRADYSWVGPNTATWDTTALNWTDGITSPIVWTNGNAAVFNGFSTTNEITLGANIVATSLTTYGTNGGTTVQLKGGTFSIDVAAISVNGASIDFSARITGNHGLTVTATSSSRLNLKTAADYTGDTFLNTGAYLLLDGVNDTLPTGTTLNMVSGTTFRLAKVNLTQEIAGLSGTGTVNASTTGNVLTLTTKTGVTTTYSGTISSTTGLGLVIRGSGTQALNGSNLSFTGTTTVSGGTLSLGGNLTNNTAVTVNGGVLASSVANVNLGTGAVTLSSGEISARGNAAAGTFTLAANQNFSSTGGKLTFNIGTASDQIKGSGTGTFSIGSGTELALILGAGFSYASTYQLFDGFAGGSVAATGVSVTGYDTANWLASLSNTGVLSFSATAVPEPSTYAALVGVATLGFAALRRRRTLP